VLATYFGTKDRRLADGNRRGRSVLGAAKAPEHLQARPNQAVPAGIRWQDRLREASVVYLDGYAGRGRYDDGRPASAELMLKIAEDQGSHGIRYNLLSFQRSGAQPGLFHSRSPTRYDPRMSIAQRLEDAEFLWDSGRFEGAFLSALIAFAATARRVRPRPIQDNIAFKELFKEQFGDG
jgi:hypothetical protein